MSGTLSAQPWAGALEAVDRILNREPEADEALRRVVEVLRERIPHYTWVGLYFVEEDELVLGPWSGDAGLPEHTRLPLAEGAIGRAVATRATQVVADAASDASSPPCFAWTRAEIDVPVVYQGAPVAVIGIDSDRPDPLAGDDRAFLERVATLVSAHCLVGWDTGGVPWEEVG